MYQRMQWFWSLNYIGSCLHLLHPLSNFLSCFLRGIDLSKWREIQKEKAEVADLDKFAKHVHENHFFPNTVLVDCTADTNVANHYYDWLRKGIHVITPNKKANSGPLDRVISSSIG